MFANVGNANFSEIALHRKTVCSATLLSSLSFSFLKLSHIISLSGNNMSSANTSTMAGHAMNYLRTSLESAALHMQEPFRTYRHGVVAVLKHIFPDIAKSSIYRMEGGTYNRVTGVSVKINGTRKEYVYRAPRDPYTSLAGQIRMLRYLERQPRIPTPRIVAVRDVQPSLKIPTDRPEGSPYGNSVADSGENFVLMEKIEGLPLHITYRRMTFRQRVHLARQFANLMADIFEIPVPQVVGRIGVSVDGNRLEIEPFFRNQIRPNTVLRTYPDHTLDQGMAQTQADVSTCLTKLFEYGHWIETAAADSKYRMIYQQLIDAVKILIGTPKRSNTKIVFLHADLAPRNVIVKPSPLRRAPWSISGAIDWDNCLALPAEAAYWSPNWLWDDYNQIRNRWEFDADPNFVPFRLEGRVIKAEFVRTIEARIPGYMEVVRRSREAKIKQLFELATHGLWHAVGQQAIAEILAAAGLPRLFEAPESSALRVTSDGPGQAIAQGGGVLDKASICSSSVGLDSALDSLATLSPIAEANVDEETTEEPEVLEGNAQPAEITQPCNVADNDVDNCDEVEDPSSVSSIRRTFDKYLERRKARVLKRRSKIKKVSGFIVKAFSKG